MSVAHNQEEDEADLKASQQGDPEAYARLVKRYEASISLQMWRFTRDPVLHRELVQDVFVEAYLSLHSYRFKAPWIHWLRSVATRRGYQFWKRNAREQAARLALHRADWPQWADEAGAEDLAESEAAEWVHKVLAQLPPRDRLVLTLLHLEELSIAEIAGRLGWSQSMVKVQAYRARKKLRRLLEDLEDARET